MNNTALAPGAAGPTDSQPLDDLATSVYEQVRRHARRLLAQEPDNPTLQATELANEGFMKLARQGRQGFNGPSHLIAACVRAMRWILVDRARRRKSQRRGGQLIRVEMDSVARCSRPVRRRRQRVRGEAPDRPARPTPRDGTSAVGRHGSAPQPAPGRRRIERSSVSRWRWPAVQDVG